MKAKLKKHSLELLAPAGNLEKMKYAIHYGADAVYAGVPDFSLRVRINNFTPETLKEGIDYARKNKKKVYVTINIYAHNQHLKEVEKHLKFLSTTKVDGLIISDPGIIRLAKKYLPKTEIHLSTQANTTNWQAAKFWYEQGVKRIVLARETTLEEIREIKKHVPKLELEYFVHGAMCMSYSGRCILSKWMTGRSANLGDCSQPCRWQYDIKNKISKIKYDDDEILTMGVEDAQKRFVVDLEEDRHGTYFFNSYDLNLLLHLDKLIEAGVTSFKIEGRAKSVYYVASVMRAYREVLDAITKKISKKKLANIISKNQKELGNLVNRGYTEGFLFGNEPEHNFDNHNSENDYKFVGQIEGAENKMNIVRAHNEIFANDKLEALTPEGIFPVKIKKIYNYKMEEVFEAHGGHEKRYFFQLNKILPEKALLRKKI